MDSRISKLKTKGQDHYRKQEYKQALECFSQIINEYTGVPIEIYDARAAVHTKLGNLPGALKDGQHMIRMRKNEVTGYLRAGQILQKMGKDATALGIYQYGLRNVPVNAPNASFLCGMHQKLTTKCTPPRHVDPFAILPLELAVLVAGFLPFKHLVAATRVSKHWRDVLTSQPVLWRQMDFSQVRRRLKTASLKVCLKNARSQLQRATLNWIRGNEDIVIKEVVAHSARLEHLEILDGLITMLPLLTRAANLKTIILAEKSETTLGNVSALLEGCENLARAEFHAVRENGQVKWGPRPFSSLQTLDLWGSSLSPCQWEHLVPWDLFRKLPNLHTLTMKNWQVLVRAGSLDFYRLLPVLKNLTHESSFCSSLAVPSSVERLSIESEVGNVYGAHIDDDVDADIPIPQRPLPPLVDLHISHAHGLVVQDLVERLRRSVSTLKRLRIMRSADEDFALKLLRAPICPGPIGSPEVPFVEACLAAVERLALPLCGVSDIALGLIAKHCPQLRALDVSANPELTGAGVVSVVSKAGAKLEELNLTHCLGVSPDAVEWARQKGVRVIFHFPDNKSGKKLRTAY